MRSIGNFQRLLDMAPSPVNGITLCQGNFTLMTDDLPSVIREFGRQKKIFFVHFRDVLGTADNFVETWHDQGKTDFIACLEAYKEVGFEGPCDRTTSPLSMVTATTRPGTRPSGACMRSATSGASATSSTAGRRYRRGPPP